MSALREGESGEEGPGDSPEEEEGEREDRRRRRSQFTNKNLERGQEKRVEMCCAAIFFRRGRQNLCRNKSFKKCGKGFKIFSF